MYLSYSLRNFRRIYIIKICVYYRKWVEGFECRRISYLRISFNEIRCELFNVGHIEGKSLIIQGITELKVPLIAYRVQ